MNILTLLKLYFLIHIRKFRYKLILKKHDQNIKKEASAFFKLAFTDGRIWNKTDANKDPYKAIHQGADFKHYYKNFFSQCLGCVRISWVEVDAKVFLSFDLHEKPFGKFIEIVPYASLALTIPENFKKLACNQEFAKQCT